MRVLLCLVLLGGIAAADAESLDRQMISDGIKAVKANVSACGDRFKDVNGVVKVAVTVGASGKVTNVVVRAAPDPKLGVCVAEAVQAATFPPTKSGGSFSYPFVFSAPGK